MSRGRKPQEPIVSSMTFSLEEHPIYLATVCENNATSTKVHLPKELKAGTKVYVVVI